ncbi:hypothetical protein E1193_12020 [Micromonospora sp. KC606]|uniref:hypothetical protein n=1 Tax=Micromonospora sp. KC606 TaxID=2530379 RepID=UPI0010435087|nr:hypothetical protein [Micromonospora sp. KC606]TDC82380.1 hypothetical protein E1193_12020 [Micromonospora sp. KC606]
MTKSGNTSRWPLAWGLGPLVGIVIGGALFEDASGVAFGVAIGTVFAVAFNAMDGRGSAKGGPEESDSAI